MAEKREVKSWITVRGKHIPIFESESKEDAVKRATSKSGVTRKDVEELTKKKDEVSKKLGKDGIKTQPITEDEVKAQKDFWDKHRNKQIDKDNDEKEKQIKQNKKEKDDLDDLFAHMSQKTREFDNANAKRKEALGGLYKYTQVPISQVPTEKLMDIVDKLDDAKINSDFYAKEIKKRHDDKMRAHAKSRLPKWK